MYKLTKRAKHCTAECGRTDGPTLIKRKASLLKRLIHYSFIFVEATCDDCAREGIISSDNSKCPLCQVNRVFHFRFNGLERPIK